MEVFTTPAQMYSWSRARKKEGKIIGLVPTMGFFHEGHLALMRMAAHRCDLVVVSLFVNPTQFGPKEDLETYPRDLDRDLALAREQGVAVLFTPTEEIMYPEDFQTTVAVGRMSASLCGASRPGHFTGVTTVVCKLFNIVRPDLAVFGEKDFQQLMLIRQMVVDLNMDVDIIGHPIVREKDGLAMSSRNTHLSASQRPAALSLYRAIDLARGLVASGIVDTEKLRQEVSRLISSRPENQIDYIQFIDSQTLLPAVLVDRNTRMVLAVRVGDRVRLIDNGLLIQQAPDFDPI